MKVLVTGGAGWIGSHVVAQLEAEGHDVKVFDHAFGDDVRISWSIIQAVKGYDHVIHLAGVLGTHELFDRPAVAVNVNVTGTLNVLEACHRQGAGFVGISMPDVNPSIYAATKMCAHRLADAYLAAHGLPVSHVIAYNAYGPGQKIGPGHPRKIIPTFATAGWTGDPIEVWGDGRLTVDLVHVEDVARCLVDAMKFTAGEVIHAGTGHAHTVLHVAQRVQEWTGSRSEIVHLDPRSGERRKSTAKDVAPIDSVLGWFPEFSWDRIRDTVETYR